MSASGNCGCCYEQYGTEWYYTYENCPRHSATPVSAANACFNTPGSYARLAAYENGDDDPLGHNFGPLCGHCGEPLTVGAVIAHGQSCGIR